MNSDETIERKRERIRYKKNNRLPRTGRRLRVLATAMFAAVLILLCIGGKPSGFDNSSMTETGDINAEPPEIQGEGAELYITGLEKPVYQKNADEKIDPYSITKILTCYLAIENLDMDHMVTVSQYAATPLEDGTTIFLEEGEKISVRDLLYGAMLESGNDAATALGEEVSGSEEEFAKLMNQQAEEWGCENTHFVNANGWKNKDHYTTAHDMAIITARSFENEELRKIAMTREYVIGATNLNGERYLESHTLRGTKIEHITGGKTGGWTGKDSSIAVAFSVNNLEGAAVVLRDSVKFRKPDAAKLIAYSQVVTPGFIVANEGDILCEAKVKGGAETMTDLCVDEKIYAYPKDQKRSGVRMEIERYELSAPLTRGEKAGTYTLYVDDKEMQSGDLLIAENVEKGGILSDLYISDKTSVLLAAAAAMWAALMIISGRFFSRSGRR